MASKRTFEDVISRVSAMTGRRPNRSNDNIGMTKRLAERLGLTPMLTKLRVVHVAGTKGKGTTCAFASRLLAEAYGRRVGLFTSPHLFDVRERIQVNNQMLPKEKFTQYFFDIHDQIEVIASNSESEFERECASRSNFFRFMFLLSLHAFQQENVEIAVYEVGIGGRLDSTNVFPSPAVCGITTLGMDHMELLGDTVEKIAYEKAGIIKPDVPCFSVPQRFHPSTREVLAKEGRTVGAPVIFLDKDVINFRRWPELRMAGEHFVENSKLGFALARTAIGIPVPQPIVRKEWDVIEGTHIEGRSELIRVIDPIERDPHRQKTAAVLQQAIQQRRNENSSSFEKLIDDDKAVPSLNDLAFYLDGAHNPESMQVMTEWFFSLPPRGLVPIPSRPATPTSKKGDNSTSDSLPPTPPATPRTTAGMVSKVLPSHYVISKYGSSNPSTDVAVTQIRNTILFYCTRSPRDMLRYFIPYAHLIDKIIFCLIPNPKQTVGGKSMREAAEEDRMALASWTEAWRNLFREIPCSAAEESFENIADCLEVIQSTPFRDRAPAFSSLISDKTNNRTGGIENSGGDLEFENASAPTSAADDDIPKPYPSNVTFDLKTVAFEVLQSAANKDEGGKRSKVHVEDRVLVTGSVLFVGDTLKMLHDVDLYPDN